jgi:predicted Zn-dependent protease with MMP-like domain
MTDDRNDLLIEAAYEALRMGHPDQALSITQAIQGDEPEGYIVRAEAWIELALPEEAEGALKRAAEHLEDGDPNLCYVRGRLRVLQWRPTEARQDLAGLELEEFGAPLLGLRALVEEIDGDFERADALYLQAYELEPELTQPPHRFSADSFREHVAKAAGELPLPFRQAFERAIVVIDPMPTKEILDAENTNHPPDTLGLFVGAPLTEGEPVPGELPPTIFLFQRNLERWAGDEAELIQEIRTTLYHELGHALGFDEDGVEDMGLA